MQVILYYVYGIRSKNEFVLELRDYLKSKYKTEQDYICGEGEFEGRRVGNAYCFVRKDPNEPKDISGFYFREDLCYWPPQSEADILRKVHNFSLSKNLESMFKEGKGYLKIKFGDSEYLVAPHIDDGYVGDIGVYFMELPCFELEIENK